MKKAEIRVGGLYAARVAGKYTTVRVDRIHDYTDAKYRVTTAFDVTNLATGRKTTFRSAAKFRSEVKPDERKLTVLPPVTEPVLEETPNPLPAGGGSSIHSPPDSSAASPEREGEQRSDPTRASSPLTSNTTLTQETSATVGSAVPTGSSSVAPTLTTGGSLADKIAATAAAEANLTGLTQQQLDIITVAKELQGAMGGDLSATVRQVDRQWVMVICAGAGTGKTYTLKKLEEVLRGRGQYTAYNAPLVAESRGKFKKCAVNTTHSLAFHATGKQFSHRLNGRRIHSWEVAKQLGISDFAVELPEAIAPYDDGRPQVRWLKAQFLAGKVIAAVDKFCQSADQEITIKHFGRIDGIDESGKHANNDRVKAYLLPFAQAAWLDLSSKDGNLQFKHDVYVKLWQLGTGTDRPVIAADYILLDEAQDTAEVMLSILQQQKHALTIMVGDDNQQIYEWRGAINAMASFKGAPRLLLSQSFRFGQTVADVANAILAGLQEPTDLVMSGNPAIPTRVCRVEKPTCYLYRTNAGAVGKFMSGMDESKRGYLVGGSTEVLKFCRAALDLQQGKGTNHPELGCFTNWSEVQAYVKEDEGADLKLMVKLIDTFKAEKIIKALEIMPPEDQADFITSTAHRSKGREWPSVKLGMDFPTANKMTDSDRRLLYVAATRAQEELDITECPPFCGGTDGVGEQATFTPGIEVAYTVPMPGEAELAAYRAARPATRPAAPAPGKAAAADVGKANGQYIAPVAPPGTPPSAGYRWVSRDGKWVIQGPADPTWFRGRKVMVPSRAGIKEIILYSIIDKSSNKWVYGVDPSTAS